MKKVGRNALLSIYFHIFVIYSINKTKVDNSDVIYVFYLTIRALIDPKFAEKLSEMNRREKGKRGKELGNLVSMQQMAVGHHGVIAMEAQKVDIIMY